MICQSSGSIKIFVLKHTGTSFDRINLSMYMHVSIGKIDFPLIFDHSDPNLCHSTINPGYTTDFSDFKFPPTVSHTDLYFPVGCRGYPLLCLCLKYF